MITLSQPEYRDSMQAAARAYLERHQAEHLADDGQLFERAARYLVQAMEVPVFMAQRLVHLAMSLPMPAHRGQGQVAPDW